MPDIQIFVEDKLCDAYRILAIKALGASALSVHVARATLNELTSFGDLLDLARRAQRSGCQQVVFALDHEGHDAKQERVDARRRFQETFQQLCDHVARLPASDPLKQLRLVRVEVRSCLEAWLLSDPQAIVQAFSGPADYRPDVRQTEALSPARRAMESRILCARSAGARGTEDWRG